MSLAIQEQEETPLLVGQRIGDRCLPPHTIIPVTSYIKLKCILFVTKDQFSTLPVHQTEVPNLAWWKGRSLEGPAVRNDCICSYCVGGSQRTPRGGEG